MKSTMHILLDQFIILVSWFFQSYYISFERNYILQCMFSTRSVPNQHVSIKRPDINITNYQLHTEQMFNFFRIAAPNFIYLLLISYLYL